MKFEDFKEEVKRTCPHIGNNQIDNLHMILGMLTEIGELADVFKKNIAYQKPIDWINVEEEIADILWYLCNFCNINNINIENSMQNNINKLKVRFPEKFTTFHALNRNLEDERKQLEKK